MRRSVSGERLPQFVAENYRERHRTSAIHAADCAMPAAEPY